jgi:hypothetical protein
MRVSRAPIAVGTRVSLPSPLTVLLSVEQVRDRDSGDTWTTIVEPKKVLQPISTVVKIAQTASSG